MERMTVRMGDYIYYTKWKYNLTIPEECDPADVINILQALAAYEDTGLTPEQVADLRNGNCPYKKRVIDCDRDVIQICTKGRKEQ